MFVSEIHLWGAAVVACVVFVAMIALAFFDRKMLRRMLVIFGATVAQMAVVVAVVWLVYQTNAWWAYLLWFLLVLFLSTCWCLYPLQAMWKQMLWPVSVATLVGGIVLGGSAMLCLPLNVFLSVYSVLMACMTASLMQTMMSYQRNIQHPEVLRKSLLPHVRTLAQPLVMVIPMLYAGMLLGGVSALEGLLVVFLLIAASFVANILAGVIALLMLRKKEGTKMK
jgi:ABC-type iron transport system FetAB permease component